jgi:hypothetical protein
MEAKHSQGEWTANFVRYQGEVVAFHIAHPKFGSRTSICVSDTDDPIDTIPAEELEANAHLIAAAPDLLEALQWFMRLDPTFCTACDEHLNELVESGSLMAIAVKHARAAIRKATQPQESNNV